MAVYKKTYTRYEGALTPQWSRFLVPVRYHFEELQQSRFLTWFFFGTFLFPLVWALLIYVAHNLSALRLMQVPGNLISINTQFFLNFLGTQSMFAFFLAAFIGPGLVSPDLTNNALPLYLARPFTKAEYVLSKLSVLMILLSAMTWIPGLMLFGLQAYYEGGTWLSDNLRVASGLFWGSLIWILVLSFLGLALSAWVKWKPVAGGLMFGVFFVAAGFGAFINSVLRTKWGHLLNISHLVGSVWVRLFEEEAKRGSGAVFFRAAQAEEIPLWCCWGALLALCGICLLLLAQKIRGVEVVR